MLCYKRIDASEVINIDKISASKERIICHYWYLSDKRFKFQPFVCNECHDISMISMNLTCILNLFSLMKTS